MINLPTQISENLNSKVRQVKASVVVKRGDSPSSTYTESDRLIKLDIQRVGDETKFFGFGVCQRLNFHLIDRLREIDVQAGDKVEVRFDEQPSIFPDFFINEIHRDENTNEISATCYDRIYKFTSNEIKELEITNYTIKELVEGMAAFLGVELVPITDEAFDTSYPEGANFDGSENFREVFDSIAEVTQTIYYLNSDNKLCFKRLDVLGESLFTISKDKYITLSTRSNRRLVGVCHATELGDNVKESNSLTGTIQYIYDNPFWELRDDIGTLVAAAFDRVDGLTINQFSCTWRGNYALEIGDKISIITKDNEQSISYVLNDTIEYDGSLCEKTSWTFGDEAIDTESNPANLGEALKKTYARVDKVNREINLYASQNDELNDKFTHLQLTTEDITANVQNVSIRTDTINENLESLTEQVSAKISSTEVEILVQNELSNVNKVTTTTGFTFDEEGLTVSKTGSEMTTQVTEDGMTVSKNGEVTLTANNQGVETINLHAITYLIVGTNSRFEDYGGNRTGCFWVGSSS